MDRSKLRISEEQVLEWTENPVTVALTELCRHELHLTEATPTNECIVYGEPHKSHENLIELDARAACWREWVMFLEGDWSTLEDDSEEQ